MENEGTISETEIASEIGIDSQIQKEGVSKLAVASMVFGILGPFSAGFLWVVSLSLFLTVGKLGTGIITFFSCSLPWVLGLVLGVKALQQIEDSHGQLTGGEYALIGIIISVVWMILLLVALPLPAFFSINS